MKGDTIFRDSEKSRIENNSTAYQGIYNEENIRNITWISNRISTYAKNHTNILELGLGDGTTTKILSNYFKNVVTLESSINLINAFNCNYKYNNVKIIETLFEEYKSNDQYDNIAMCNVLEHVYDPGFLIEHYKKYLKKNGKIFMAVPSAKSLNRRIGNIAGLLPDIYSFQEQDIRLGHRRYFCKDTFLTFLKSHELKIETAEGVNLKILTTNQMQQLDFSENIYNALLEIGKDYPDLCTMIFVVASVM